MSTIHNSKETKLLPIDKLLFLQSMAEKQLGWIGAEALKKQMWKLLMLATDPGRDTTFKMDPVEVSDMTYMCTRLGEWFDQLDTLRPCFNEVKDKQEEC